MQSWYAISDKQSICFTDNFCYVDNISMFNVPISIKQMKPRFAKHIFGMGDCNISEENALSKMISGVPLILQLGFRQHYSYKDFCDYLITGKLKSDSYSYLVYYGTNIKVVFYHNVWALANKPVGFEFLDKNCQDIMIFYKDNKQPECSDDVFDRRSIFREQIIKELGISTLTVLKCLDDLLNKASTWVALDFYDKPIPLSNMTDGWLLDEYFKNLMKYHDVLSLVVASCKDFLSDRDLDINLFLYDMLTGDFKESSSAKNLISKYKYTFLKLHAQSKFPDECNEVVWDDLQSLTEEFCKIYFRYFLSSKKCFGVQRRVNNALYPMIMFESTYAAIDSVVILKLYELYPSIVIKALSRKITPHNTLSFTSKGKGKSAYICWEIEKVLDNRLFLYQTIIGSLTGVGIDRTVLVEQKFETGQKDWETYADIYIKDRAKLLVFDNAVHDRVFNEIVNTAVSKIAYSCTYPKIDKERKEIAFIISYIFNSYLFDKEHLVIDNNTRAHARQIDDKIYRVEIDFGVESSVYNNTYNFSGGLYIPENRRNTLGDILSRCSIGLMIRFTSILDDVDVVTPDNLMWEWQDRGENVSKLEVTYVG